MEKESGQLSFDFSDAEYHFSSRSNAATNVYSISAHLELKKLESIDKAFDRLLHHANKLGW